MIQWKLLNALGSGEEGVAPTPPPAPPPPKPPLPCNAAILSFKLPPPIPIVCEEGGVTSFGLGFHVNPPGSGLGGGGPPPPPPPDVDEPD
ncbi:hypothetical protein PQX77_013565 [Marasmius sp. AFHP31]|nr:hypothetical protein PQX77_013565 [Marasmius sp. AFHP31]